VSLTVVMDHQTATIAYCTKANKCSIYLLHMIALIMSCIQCSNNDCKSGNYL